MPRAKTGLNTVTRVLRDGTKETRWYYIKTGALIGSSLEGMTRDRALKIVREIEGEAPMAGPRVGSFGWLAASYLASARLAKKKEKTRYDYALLIGRLRERWEHREAEGITRADVTTLLSDMKATPWQANAHARVVRLLYSWGRKELKLQGDNPGLDPELHPTKPRTAIWDEDRARAFIVAAPAEIRLGFALLLYTVQRPSDMLAMDEARVMERDGRLWVLLRQEKTQELVAVPAHRVLEGLLRPRLVAMQEAHEKAKAGEAVAPRVASTLLVPAATGREWKFRAFATAWDRTRARANIAIARAAIREWGGLPPRRQAALRDEAKKAIRARMLDGLQRRDLRRTGMVMMALAGATTVQIAAVSGHSIDTTQKIIETYIPRRSDVALAGMEAWEENQVRAIALLPQAKRGK